MRNRIVENPGGFEVSYRQLIVIYNREDDTVMFNDDLLLGVKYASIPKLRELLDELEDKVEAQRGLDAAIEAARTNNTHAQR